VTKNAGGGGSTVKRVPGQFFGLLLLYSRVQKILHKIFRKMAKSPSGGPPPHPQIGGGPPPKEGVYPPSFWRVRWPKEGGRPPLLEVPEEKSATFWLPDPLWRGGRPPPHQRRGWWHDGLGGGWEDPPPVWEDPPLPDWDPNQLGSQPSQPMAGRAMNRGLLSPDCVIVSRLDMSQSCTVRAPEVTITRIL
jgi:hypothetical protein